MASCRPRDGDTRLRTCRLAGELPSPHVTAAPAYPRAERLDLVDHLHGRAVADPYRWLEDPDDPRTRDWSAAQDALARGHLDALPGRDRLAATLGALTAAGSGRGAGVAGRAAVRDAPRARPGARGPARSTEPDGARARAARPHRARPHRPHHAGRLGARPRGPPAGLPALLRRRRAVGAARPRRRPPARTSSRRSTAAATPTSPGCPAARSSSTSAWSPRTRCPPGEQAFHRRIWRHRDRHARPTPTTLIDGPGLYEEHNYYGVDVSDDGRWLLVTGNVGTARRDSVWIADLHGDGALTPVLTQADDVRCAAWVDRDGRLYLLTTDGAPRFRLAVTDPATPGREHWRELVAEDPDSVLEGVAWLQPAGSADPADGLLVLARSRHAAGELALHDARRHPARRRPAARPRLAARRHRPPTRPPRTQQGRLWIGWTDLVTPPQVRRFDLGSRRDGPGGGRPGRGRRCRRCAPSSGRSPPPTAPPCACSSSAPSRRTGRPARPAHRLRRLRHPPRPRLQPDRAGLGRRPAASTRWRRCAAAARRARPGTARATAATSRTCSTTSTPPRRPWSTPATPRRTGWRSSAAPTAACSSAPR